MKFIKLYTPDGAFYCIDCCEWAPIVAAVHNEEKKKWITLKFAASENKMWIRADDIRSFYMVSEEFRREIHEWESKWSNFEDGDKEPWQQ